MSSKISEATKKLITAMQQNEITEAAIYRNISTMVKSPQDKQVLLDISACEEEHAAIWQSYTGISPKPQKLKVLWYTAIARFVGYTFALKLMEGGEHSAGNAYAELTHEVPEAVQIAREEQEHEAALIDLLDEERLQYVGAMVLGLNDALVELTGTLAGLSFALQNNRLVALSGLITGVSATFSMASSAYLQAKSEGEQNAFKSSLYTGVMYLITVALLVLPYFLLPQHQFIPALAMMLAIVVLIIFIFTYYISVAKSLPFKKRFLEMFTISISVAVLSFVIGIVVKSVLGIEV